jgi:GT2 family glycosyltransferase
LREEAIKIWVKLHNEERHNAYSSPNIRVIRSKKNTWWGGGRMARVGKLINAYKISVSETDWKEKTA